MRLKPKFSLSCLQKIEYATRSEHSVTVRIQIALFRTACLKCHWSASRLLSARRACSLCFVNEFQNLSKRSSKHVQSSTLSSRGTKREVLPRKMSVSNRALPTGYFSSPAPCCPFVESQLRAN